MSNSRNSQEQIENADLKRQERQRPPSPLEVSQGEQGNSTTPPIQTQIPIPKKFPVPKIPRISRCMPRPYLEIKSEKFASSTSTEWDYVHITCDLECMNMGTGSSTAILEVFYGEFMFPVKLAELEKVRMEILHLPAGAEVVRKLAFNVPKDHFGVVFVLSDPLLDPCRRIIESLEDIKMERHYSTL